MTSENSQLAIQQDTSIDWGALEKVVIGGDLSQLSTQDRMSYYKTVCESVGLNPATQPFEYIKLSGKLTLYPKRDATDQLRRIHRVSVSIVDRQRIEDVYIVTARATTPDGRTDESTGVVSIGNLKGDNLANALMKAETKAKRRVTLSICGLGMLDESEIETIRGAETFNVDQVHQTSTPVRTESPAPIHHAEQLEPTVPGDGPAMASEKQIKMITALAKELDLTAVEFKNDWLQKRFGVESRKDLTKQQASELITLMQAKGLVDRMQAATTEKDLNLVAAEVKELSIEGMARKRLLDVYSECMENLSSSADDDELDAAWDAAAEQG